MAQLCFRKPSALSALFLQFLGPNYLQIHCSKDGKRKATQMLFPFPCDKETLGVWCLVWKNISLISGYIQNLDLMNDQRAPCISMTQLSCFQNVADDVGTWLIYCRNADIEPQINPDKPNKNLFKNTGTHKGFWITQSGSHTQVLRLKSVS